MNIVDKLLKLDAGKIQMPEKVIKMTPKKLGIELEFPCKAINPERYSEIQEEAIELKKGDIKKISMHRTKILTLIEGCPDVFKSKELQTHFGCPTPGVLISKLLLSGEIDDLYNEIVVLNGYEKDEDDEEDKDIKNL